MDLEMLRDVWKGYDKQLNDRINLNMQQIKKMNLHKTRSELDKFLRTPLYGLMIGFGLQAFLIYFIVNHITMTQFLAPAVLINLYVLLQIIVSIFQTSVILKLNYDSPIIDMQKKLARLNLGRIRYLTTTRFSYPLLWVPVLIVASKGIFDLDLYLHLEQWWIWLQIGLGVLFLTFGVWLSKQYASKKHTSGLLNKLMSNITKNDITGKNLVYAMSFLDDIAEFESEN